MTRFTGARADPGRILILAMDACPAPSLDPYAEVQVLESRGELEQALRRQETLARLSTGDAQPWRRVAELASRAGDLAAETPRAPRDIGCRAAQPAGAAVTSLALPLQQSERNPPRGGLQLGRMLGIRCTTTC